MAIDWLLSETASMLRKPADDLDLRSEISLTELAARLTFDVQRDLLEYWDVIRGEGHLPARSDFDPLAVPHALPYVGLIDIIEPGPQFRYRLIGTKLPAYAGGRLEGRLVDEQKTPGIAAYLNCVYELPYRFRQPVFIRECADYEDGDEDCLARLILPMAQDRNMPDMLLVSIIYETQNNPGQQRRETTPRSCRALSMVSARP
ncbi:PAS domain-containing protein [Denitrobaculum tricleocarpae]|nr:PAS domain-containing protein [Denitrobaculum tricleocarpae]